MTKLILIAILSVVSNLADGLPKDCAIEARAWQLLHNAGCWTRLVRIEYGDDKDGHAVCVFALANNDLWVYDANTGSRKLETKSHDLVEIAKALGLYFDRIRLARFMDDQ